jgi:hypothetical protein
VEVPDGDSRTALGFKGCFALQSEHVRFETKPARSRGRAIEGRISMIRLSILGLLLIVAICCVAPAMAATPAPAPAAQLTLTADPFLAAATVTTTIREAHHCTCTISSGCPFAGFDCADPAGCCHCAGPSPSQLTCVSNF